MSDPYETTLLISFTVRFSALEYAIVAGIAVSPKRANKIGPNGKNKNTGFEVGIKSSFSGDVKIPRTKITKIIKRVIDVVTVSRMAAFLTVKKIAADPKIQKNNNLTANGNVGATRFAKLNDKTRYAVRVKNTAVRIITFVMFAARLPQYISTYPGKR